MLLSKRIYCIIENNNEINSISDEILNSYEVSCELIHCNIFAWIVRYVRNKLLLANTSWNTLVTKFAYNLCFFVHCCTFSYSH